MVVRVGAEVGRVVVRDRKGNRDIGRPGAADELEVEPGVLRPLGRDLLDLIDVGPRRLAVDESDAQRLPRLPEEAALGDRLARWVGEAGSGGKAAHGPRQATVAEGQAYL